MHAVVFTVDRKQDWTGDLDQELDSMTGALKSAPGFIRGTWATDAGRGISFSLFESEQAARAVADNAAVPPSASVILRSADVYEVVRDV
jgi:hypothetical protein